MATPSSLHVQDIVTGTQNAGQGRTKLTSPMSAFIRRQAFINILTYPYLIVPETLNFTAINTS